MGLLNLFKESKVKDWDIINQKTRESITKYEGYLLRSHKKIKLFQEIYLKIFDFNNSHFFEKNEIKYLRSGVSGSSSPKLYETYFKLINKRLDKINELIKTEFKLGKNEKDNLDFIHKRLVNLISKNKNIKSQEKEIQTLQNKFDKLESNLLNQLELLKELSEKFTWFVGNEERWESDYSNAIREYKNTKLYSNVLEQKEEIFSEWKEFTKVLENLKSKIKQEITLTINKTPGNDVSNWDAIFLGKLKSLDSLKSLNILFRISAKIKEMSNEVKIELYHATERSGSIFPLTESKYSGGFYGCIGKDVYARKIKSDQSSDYGAKIKVVKINLPLSLFKNLFLPDNHSGKDGDKLSIQAYDNAYFLPVSRFPLVNDYFDKGLIEEL